MINVIGLGYIGLPTALMFASHGEKVVGTDHKQDLVESLREGRLAETEEGLDRLYEDATNNISYTTNYVTADMYIVAVPTPYNKNSKKIDPSYVIEAVSEILKVCPDETIVVVESTISPGTIDTYIRPVISTAQETYGKIIHLVHAPERIIPGNMVNELAHNARTIGADDVEIGKKVKKKYQSFCKGEIVLTNIRTAEMTKVVENTYRDINIAFANELSKICHVAGIDVHEVIRIANMHPRVSILSPGPGVGGHCIAVDPWFLVGDYPQLTRLVLAARQVNESMPDFVMERMSDIMRENSLTDLNRVGIYGLTYKENVPDMRESPSMQLLERMSKNMAFGVQVYDPFVHDKVVDHQCFVFEDFISRVDFVVVMVAHQQIRERADELKGKLVLDCRNILRGENVYRL